MAPIQFLINIVSVSAAVFLIYWTKSGNLNSQIHYLFEQKKLNTAQLQADHLADLAYYYAIYTLFLSIIVTLIRFIRRQFNQALAPDVKVVQNINKNISKSLQHFIIFASIYVYLLQKKGFGMNTNTLLLMPFLFLLGRIVSFIEQILTELIKNKFLFSYIGFTLSTFPYIVMLGQIFGYSPLKWF